MSTTLQLSLSLTAIFAAILVILLAVRFYRYVTSVKPESRTVELLPEPAPKLAAETAHAEAAESEAAAADDTAEIGELIDDEDDREIFNRRVSFCEKMLELDVRTQEYYDEIVNEFNSYRKIHKRLSNRFVSFRFGRKLVAKISARGRTMKLHLALDCKDFEERIYFQKDLSDVKTYAETPFTVKVKSDRGLKKAISLIGALALKEGMEKKTRTNYVDSMEEVRHLVMESKKDAE